MFTSIRKCWGHSDVFSRLHRRRRSPSAEVDGKIQHSATSEGASMEHSTTAEDTGRTLLMHSPVQLGTGWRKKRRHLFLFSDLLLISNTKYRKIFKIKNKIPLQTMWTSNCMDQVGKANKGARSSFVFGCSTVNFVATFSSSELKEKWLSILQRHIDLAKEKDLLKSCPLTIFTEDLGSCAPDPERDYQPSVSSGKDEAPYALIGHEHPNDLTESHLLATALLPQGPEDSTSPPPKGSPKMQDAGLKSDHMRSPITSPSWQGLPTSQDNQVVTPPPAKPKQLFGSSLTDLCEDDTLPGPLLDMLSSINKKGPFTEGIFRKWADRDSCRVLTHRLNSGDKVNLDSESVLVVACVLKDFLRNIPGSIFTPGAYDKWLGVMDQGNDAEKIAASQRLLEQLPRANAELLRHLFGLLRTLQLHSSTNQMTARNLGVSLTPSLFCLPVPCHSDLVKDLRKRLSQFNLTQFLIENGLQIFGDDISSLCEESRLVGDTSKEAATPGKNVSGTGEKQTPRLPGAVGDAQAGL